LPSMIHARYLLSGIAKIIVKTMIEVGSNHIGIISLLNNESAVAMLLLNAVAS